MTSPPGRAASAPPPAVLVVAADDALRETLTRELTGAVTLSFAADEVAAIEAVRAGDIALLVVDSAGSGGEDAFALRASFQTAGLAVPMVMMTNQGDEDLAVEALQRGFLDYIVKRARNLQADLLQRRIGNTIELGRLQRENELLHGAIEESQQRLFNIYDSLDDVIMQIDSDCRVVSLNRSAAALADGEPRDAVGRACHELFGFFPCEARRLKADCHIYRTFLEGETIRGERQDAGNAANESTASVHEYMTFITTLDDRDYVVYRETDITEKRRLEEKVENALRSLGVDAGTDGTTGDDG